MQIQLYEQFIEAQDDLYVIYEQPCIVYHTTASEIAKEIEANGFKTGHELNVAERRKAIYFSDKDVNVDMYARNAEGETYAGQLSGQVAVNIAGLRLLNLNYGDNHAQYNRAVVRGELDALPTGCDGAISYLEDGRIYEVALKKEVANALLTRHIQRFESYGGAQGGQKFKKRSKKLETALKMERAQRPVEEIRAVTGWFRNPYDQKWRYEIADKQIIFLPIYLNGKYFTTSDNDITVKLEDLITKTSLFTEYPEMRQLKVQLVNTMHSNPFVYGIYKSEQKRIILFMVPLHLTELKKENNTTQSIYTVTKDMKACIIHEIQHFIQDVEGFSPGGAPQEFKHIDRYEQRVKALIAEFEQNFPLFKKANAAYQTLRGEEFFNSSVANHYDEIADSVGFTQALKDLRKNYGDEPGITPMDQYLSLAGEIEARDTELRMQYDKKSQWLVIDYRIFSFDTVTGKATDGVLAYFDTEKEARTKQAFVARKNGVRLDYTGVTRTNSRSSMKPYAQTETPTVIVKKPKNDTK